MKSDLSRIRFLDGSKAALEIIHLQAYALFVNMVHVSAVEFQKML